MEILDNSVVVERDFTDLVELVGILLAGCTV
jgi:hypothetical protein